MKTLKKRLSEGLARVYVVEGDDYYLFDKAFLMIKNACGITLDDFNVNVFDEESFSTDKLFAATELLPIIDEKRLVVIKGGKLSEGDKKRTTEILLHIPKTTVVVVLDYNKNFEFLKKDFVLVDANRMDKELVKKLITAYLARISKKIDADAMDELIESCNGYLTRIMNELNKLVCFDLDSENITKESVDKLVNKDIEFSVFELTEALSKKDGDKAIRLLKLMEKDQGVFALISNQFRRLFYASISDLTNAELAGLLGVKEFAIMKARQLAKGFSKAQLKKICSLLEEMDYAVKSGAVLQTNALYLLVFNILYV
ncbi:MAG TPA: DNA polymerase III subunit delta [Clostridiales bacterium]|nr:DNA polymerase III subunit delta [Clostridiales bacterium]